MARPKKINTEQFSGRDRTQDIKSFTLEPLTTVPESKEWYSEFQKEFFVETCTALIEARQLRSVDIPNIEIAGAWYDLARHAMDNLREFGYYQTTEGKTWAQVTPHLSALEKASKALQMFADRYGTNLTSVSKIPKAKSDKNKLSEMFEPNN